ncbi:MAG: hypothetical protein A07HR67_02733 [uncultured archaeon A07HR67]|nr:MAG: hypothetical protein A07HR67_02733 [uncultured archaeon A07HR67]
MDRRTYLAGFGSLAAGAAVLGTAATTTFSVNDRTANVNIVADNPAGVIGFDIQNTDSEVINESGVEGAANEVEIDLGEASVSEIGDDGASGSGVNVGSVVNVGTIDRTNRTNSEPSLKIINQSTSDDLEFTFDFNSVSGSDLGSAKLNLLFEFQDPDGNVEDAVINATGSGPTITSGDSTGNLEISTPARRTTSRSE